MFKSVRFLPYVIWSVFGGRQNMVLDQCNWVNDADPDDGTFRGHYAINVDDPSAYCNYRIIWDENSEEAELFDFKTESVAELSWYYECDMDNDQVLKYISYDLECSDGVAIPYDSSSTQFNCDSDANGECLFEWETALNVEYDTDGCSASTGQTQTVRHTYGVNGACDQDDQGGSMLTVCSDPDTENGFKIEPYTDWQCEDSNASSILFADGDCDEQLFDVYVNGNLTLGGVFSSVSCTGEIWYPDGQLDYLGDCDQCQDQIDACADSTEPFYYYCEYLADVFGYYLPSCSNTWDATDDALQNMCGGPMGPDTEDTVCDLIGFTPMFDCLREGGEDDEPACYSQMMSRSDSDDYPMNMTDGPGCDEFECMALCVDDTCTQALYSNPQKFDFENSDTLFLDVNTYCSGNLEDGSTPAECTDLQATLLCHVECDGGGGDDGGRDDSCFDSTEFQTLVWNCVFETDCYPPFDALLMPLFDDENGGGLTCPSDVCLESDYEAEKATYCEDGAHAAYCADSDFAALWNAALGCAVSCYAPCIRSCTDTTCAEFDFDREDNSELWSDINTFCSGNLKDGSTPADCAGVQAAVMCTVEACGGDDSCFESSELKTLRWDCVFDTDCYPPFETLLAPMFDDENGGGLNCQDMCLESDYEAEKTAYCTDGANAVYCADSDFVALWSAALECFEVPCEVPCIRSCAEDTTCAEGLFGTNVSDAAVDFDSDGEVWSDINTFCSGNLEDGSTPANCTVLQATVLCFGDCDGDDSDGDDSCFGTSETFKNAMIECVFDPDCYPAFDALLAPMFDDENGGGLNCTLDLCAPSDYEAEKTTYCDDENTCNDNFEALWSEVMTCGNEECMWASCEGEIVDCRDNEDCAEELQWIMNIEDDSAIFMNMAQGWYCDDKEGGCTEEFETAFTCVNGAGCIESGDDQCFESNCEDELYACKANTNCRDTLVTITLDRTACERNITYMEEDDSDYQYCPEKCDELIDSSQVSQCGTLMDQSWGPIPITVQSVYNKCEKACDDCDDWLEGGIEGCGSGQCGESWIDLSVCMITNCGDPEDDGDCFSDTCTEQFIGCLFTQDCYEDWGWVNNYFEDMEERQNVTAEELFWYNDWMASEHEECTMDSLFFDAGGACYDVDFDQSPECRAAAFQCYYWDIKQYCDTDGGEQAGCSARFWDMFNCLFSCEWGVGTTVRPTSEPTTAAPTTAAPVTAAPVIAYTTESEDSAGTTEDPVGGGVEGYVVRHLLMIVGGLAFIFY